METIKILQLNVWTGRIKGALLEFIKNNHFDIICLQEAVWSKKKELLEIFSATVDQIKKASNLSYESRIANWDINAFNSKVFQGNVILTNKKIINERIETVHGKYSTIQSKQDSTEHCYKAQLVKLANGINVVNYHGYWQPNPIGNQDTINAMKKVANMIKEAKGPIIMCGDLNIIHESPAMRELDFLTDLTSKYNIDNTLVGLKFNGRVACDHILTNDQIDVISFNVLDVIISDHKALVAEIAITK